MIAKEAKNIENLYDYSTNYNKLHVKITSSNTNNKIYSQFMDDVLCYTSLANNVCKCNCYGTCGELVEGQFLDGRDFLISLPINVTNEIEVIPECNNAQFSFDNPDSPPNSRFVNISFDLTENGTVRQYHIDSAIRCWAGHQISADGRGIIDDDD